MGKVKRIRQKYHSSLKKEENQDEKMSSPVSNISSIPQLVPIIDKTEIQRTQSDNLFAGLQIKLDVKNTSEAVGQNEADTMSVTSSSIGFQKTLSKKAKRQQRKDAFLKKIDTIRAVEKEVKERKKREKTAIVGDVHPMLSALPSLEELLAASAKEKQTSPQKVRSTKKQKKANKDMMSDLQMFMAVHRDQEFKKDPFAAVSTAVQNRVLYEDEDNKK